MKKLNNKRKFFIIMTLFLIIIFSISLIGNSYCLTPRLVNKMNYAFQNIKTWLLRLATPAAAVAVGVGLFMKKFSFGDEERLRAAKKVIRGSLVSYGVLLGIDLILNAIEILIR